MLASRAGASFLRSAVRQPIRSQLTLTRSVGQRGYASLGGAHKASDRTWYVSLCTSSCPTSVIPIPLTTPKAAHLPRNLPPHRLLPSVKRIRKEEAHRSRKGTRRLQEPRRTCAGTTYQAGSRQGEAETYQFGQQQHELQNPR